MTTIPNTPAEKQSALSLSSVATLMARVVEVETNDLGFPQDTKFLEYATLVRLGLFRLVVMGEIKKGKSTFINALCGIRDLVPAQTEVATSTIFKIRYGAKLRYTVFFVQKEGEPLRKQEISPAELKEYGTETGNPGNIKGVDFISIEAPSPVLSGGLVIVDTPGVGGVFKEHREVTFKYAPKADGIFFVVDSTESPIGAAEIEFLQELRGITKKIYFVQTKADLVDGEAAEKRMRNNLAILQKAGFDPKELDYFVVSSSLKLDGDEARDIDDLNDSGFVPLMRYFESRLKADLDRTIGAVALDRSREKLSNVATEVAYRRRILDADTAEKRAALAAENEAAMAKLREWRSTRLQTEKLEFNARLQESIGDAQRSLRHALKPGGELSSWVASQLRRFSHAEEIYSQAPVYLGELESDASSHLLSTCNTLEQQLRQAIGDLEAKVRQESLELLQNESATAKINRGQVASLYGGSEDAADVLRQKAREFRTVSGALDRAGRALRGGGVSGAIVGFAAGLASAFFPVLLPFVPAIIGAGSLGGAVAADRGGGRREAEGARNEVQRIVDTELNNLLEQASEQIVKISSKMSVQAVEALNGILDSVMNQLEQRKALVQQRGLETAAELKKLHTAQVELETKTSQLLKEVEALSRHVA